MTELPLLSSIVSEFASLEEADAYGRWLRAKIEAALADVRPAIPHDAVMAEMNGVIAGEARERC